MFGIFGRLQRVPNHLGLSRLDPWPLELHWFCQIPVASQSASFPRSSQASPTLHLDPPISWIQSWQSLQCLRLWLLNQSNTPAHHCLHEHGRQFFLSFMSIILYYDSMNSCCLPLVPDWSQLWKRRTLSWKPAWLSRKLDNIKDNCCPADAIIPFFDSCFDFIYLSSWVADQP